MKARRILSLSLCLVMVLSVLFWTAPAVSADYAGVDYSRFNYSTNGKVYPASLIIGNIKFNGTLRCTNNFDLSDINDAIGEFFEATGLSERDILDAEQKIKTAEKDRQFNREDAIRITSNLLQIFGADTAVEVSTFMVEDICKVLLSEDKGQTIAEFAIDAVIQELGVIDGALQEAALDAAFWKVFNTSFESFADNFSLEWEKIGKINPMAMLIETLKVSYKEYQLDVERWKRRVEAVNAKEFLKDFYDAINMILDQREGSSGSWQLKIVSTRDRYFSFYGSENNLQRWSAVVLMNGESTSTVSPKGVFEGTIALYAGHDMTPFDMKLWNSAFGRFKDGWLKDVISTGFYRVRMAGGTYISRSIIMDEASFRITASDLLTTFSSRSKGLPMRVRFDSASFDVDDVRVSSNRSITVDTSVGFEDANENLTGYVVIDMALHAEGMEGGGDGMPVSATPSRSAKRRTITVDSKEQITVIFVGGLKVVQPLID